ncbi:hypothetical protein I7I48_03149 [Histoplasma ohiense]|nr:hypothetical protein I7I48_03149 [Histoplasma ohiense (nom. inval.)]
MPVILITTMNTTIERSLKLLLISMSRCNNIGINIHMICRLCHHGKNLLVGCNVKSPIQIEVSKMPIDSTEKQSNKKIRQFNNLLHTYNQLKSVCSILIANTIRNHTSI